MTGIVNESLEPKLRLQLIGPHGEFVEVDAIIDSGFNSFLSISQELADQLQLVPDFQGIVLLADGSRRVVGKYYVQIVWDSTFREILATVASNEVLIGSQLLSGYELRVSFVSGGVVQLSPLV